MPHSPASPLRESEAPDPTDPPRSARAQVIAEQVKEKFGSLEVYVNAAGEEHIAGEQKGNDPHGQCHE